MPIRIWVGALWMAHATCYPAELTIHAGSASSLNKNLTGYGWSLAEARAGKGFAWINKMEADLAFDWPSSEAITLTLNAAPFFLVARQQVVGIFANGNFIGEWTYPESADEQTYSIQIPAEHVRAGANTITFRMAYLSRAKSPDSRKLGLMVDWVKIVSKEAR